MCGKSLSLTGTLLGGYSSTIFHLLYRFSPEIRTEFGRSDEHRWIQRYGFEEVTVGKPDDDAVEDGRNSRRRSYRKVTRERPGLVPSALFHIIGNTVFLRLADVASGLPDYEEKILVSSMDSEEDATGYSQRTAYNTVFEELRKELAAALKGGRATIGVQRTSSDPHIESFDDLDESGLTREVSAVIERARARWEDAPKYPAHERPALPARRRNRRGQGEAQASDAEAGAEQEQQQTLRLF